MSHFVRLVDGSGSLVDEVEFSRVPNVGEFVHLVDHSGGSRRERWRKVLRVGHLSTMSPASKFDPTNRVVALLVVGEPSTLPFIAQG